MAGATAAGAAAGTAIAPGVGTAIGAGAGAIIDTVGMLNSNRQASKSQKAMFDQQAWLLENSYQKTAEDMKRAGLNPAVMWGGGGSATAVGTPGGRTPGASMGGNTVGMAKMGMDLALVKAQKSNIDADTELKQAQAGKTPSEIALNKASEALVNAQTNVQKEQIGKIQGEMMTLQAEADRINAELPKITAESESAVKNRRLREINNQLNTLADTAEKTANATGVVPARKTKGEHTNKMTVGR